MEVLDETQAEAVCAVVQRFLVSGTTGCGFAHSLARSGTGIAWLALSGNMDADLPGQLDALLDQAAMDRELAILIFPDMRTSSDVASMLQALCLGQRWSMELQPWKKHERTDALVHVMWTNGDGDRTSALGLAPLGSMPVVRRAPFVSIAVWPGPRSNEHRTEQEEIISIGDMPSPAGLDADGYRKMFAEAKARVKVLTAIPPEGAAMRQVTFCLDGEGAERLRQGRA